MADPAVAGAIRTLVLATDFSDTARAALDWAAEIAAAHAAKLVLFHALPPPIPTATAVPEFVPLPAGLHEGLRARALERLEELAAPLRERGLEAVTDLELGPGPSTILEAADRWKADLLVAGTRGLTGFGRLLLGSTAARLVQRARCPVLTVHPEDAGQHRPVRTVLVPTDFSEDAEIAIRAATRLLGPSGSSARLILLHAYHLPVEFTMLGAPPVLPEVFAESGAGARQRLGEVAQGLRAGGLQVETLAREGYPPAVIEEEARILGADLIAMGTHGRSGIKHLLLGSTAERVLPHAPCPVLTVRRAG